MPRRSLVTFAVAPAALAALATLSPGVVRSSGLGAQEPAPRASTRSGRGYAFAISDHHARIGVVVRTVASTESDKLGAKLEGVSPGGPADKAGLKVGDIITKFNGTALAGAKPEDEEESGPGTELVRLARKLEPGDTVRVEYRRGADTKQATLVAEDLGGFRMDYMAPDGPLVVTPPTIRIHPNMEPNRLFDMDMLFGAPWGDLELVAMNADLGEYFGTKEGVLVLKAPAESSLALRAGDVILSIGGRKPSSPAHAMRILRSYDKGETVTIDVLRHQKHVSVAWNVPTERRRVFRRREDGDGREHDEESGLRRVRPWRRTRVQLV